MVKSPPELWAECSEAASLARHLGQFGDIRITRLEPETAVAWEGEDVSGTVRLEASGWGTRVILTARGTGAQKAPAPQVPATEEPSPPPDPDPEPEPEPLPPAATGPPVAPVASEPASATSARPARRAGLIARLMALFQPPEPPPMPLASASTPPSTSTPPPTPRPAAAPRPAAHSSQSVAPAAQPDAEEPPDPEVGDELDHAAVLTAALDSLGQAHHRPYSRA